MATTNLATLKKSSDFLVFSEKEYNFSFNEHRGGCFTKIVPEKVSAYGVTWEVCLKWIDKGWGDYYFEYSTDGVNSFTELIKEGVKISGATPEYLVSLPIDWVELLNGFSGIDSLQGGYYSGSECEINVCEKYITLTGTYSRNSCKAMTGWTYNKPLAQFFLDGKDNTPAYLAYCKRKQYKEKIKNLLEEGLSKEQATMFLNAKGQWKHENKPDWYFHMVSKQPNKAVWEALANASGREHGNKIAAKYGLEGFFDFNSFPRNTDTASIISQLCTQNSPLGGCDYGVIKKDRPYPTSGNGWALLNA